MGFFREDSIPMVFDGLTVFGGNGGSGMVPGKQKLRGVFLLVG